MNEGLIIAASRIFETLIPVRFRSFHQVVPFLIATRFPLNDTRVWIPDPLLLQVLYDKLEKIFALKLAACLRQRGTIETFRAEFERSEGWKISSHYKRIESTPPEIEFNMFHQLFSLFRISSPWLIIWLLSPNFYYNKIAFKILLATLSLSWLDCLEIMQ